MKSKKGFTLVELIGVILVLSILLFIAVPSVIEILNNSKVKKGEELAHMLELATETYVEQNRDLFPELEKAGERAFIRVGTLIDKRLVSDDIKGINNENIDNYSVIASTGNDNVITYKYVNIDSDISGYITDGLKVLYDGYSAVYLEGELLKWTDSIGNNQPLIIRNSADIGIQQNGYIMLDGVDDYIELENADSFAASDGSYTIQITYNVYKDMPEDSQFLSKGLGFYYLDVYEGRIVGMISNSANDGNIFPQSTNTNLGTKNMLHTLTVTVAKNGSDYDIQYFSGNTKLTMTEATGKPHYEAGNYYRIGIDYEEGTAFLKVHGFKMYNRVLTDAEIKNNYLVDKTRYE